MKIILIVLGALCIYQLQRILYRKYWNKNLTVEIRFTQHAIWEREEGELCETIVNQKWLPLPMLRVKFEADRHLDFMQEGNISVTDRCYKNDIFSVMMYQKIVRRLKFQGIRRGYYTIRQISADSSDLFMDQHLREEIPDIVLRTTLIAGFPGETEKEHREVLEFVDDMEFDRLGVFAYSPEEDTKAALMEGQISEEQKEAWRDEIMELQQQIAFEKAQDMVGHIFEVFIEGKLADEDVYMGRTYMDAPNVDGYVFVNTRRELLSGDFVKVRITGALEYDLIGEIEHEFAE